MFFFFLIVSESSFWHISARHVWDQFRTCWINTYLRSSDVIIADSDKQFVFREFKDYADNMNIIVKIVSIETHHSIEMMKRYHESLRRAYSIISTEISEIDLELALQMTFKVINDSIEFYDLIFILLIEIWARYSDSCILFSSNFKQKFESGTALLAAFIQIKFQAEFDLRNFNQKFEYRQFAVLSTSGSDNSL